MLPAMIASSQVVRLQHLPMAIGQQFTLCRSIHGPCGPVCAAQAKADKAVPMKKKPQAEDAPGEARPCVATAVSFWCFADSCACLREVSTCRARPATTRPARMPMAAPSCTAGGATVVSTG